MPITERQTKVLDLNEMFGKVPFGFTNGQEMSHVFETSSYRDSLLLETAQIDCIGVSFLRPALRGLAVAAHSRNGNPLVAFMNPNEDTYTVFDWMSDFNGVVVKENNIELITGAPQLRITFEVAAEITQSQENFTVNEMAEFQNSKPQATHARLMRLAEMGAVTRWPDKSATHGKRHIFRSLIQADLP